MSYLGIDVGTSQTKAVAFDDHLRPLAQASVAYERTYPQPGWCELDPHRLTDAVRAVFGQCAAQCTEDRIRAISFSAGMQSFVPVPFSHHPLDNNPNA